MQGGINEVKEYALSDSDIRKVLGREIPIIPYPELKDYTSIEQCFDRKGRCILLFLTNSPTEGHWCCMLNKKKGIEFFDPYGDAPEEQLEDMPPSKLAALEQDRPYLTRLLRASGRPVYYNTHAFQKTKDGVNTCGRWCIARLLYAPKSLEYFKSVVDKSGMEPDTFVSGLVANFLGK